MIINVTIRVFNEATSLTHITKLLMRREDDYRLQIVKYLKGGDQDLVEGTIPSSPGDFSTNILYKLLTSLIHVTYPSVSASFIH
jgi:hypothetical protein